MDILLFLFLTVTYGDPIFDELSSYEFPSNVVIIRATDNDFESFPIIQLGFFYLGHRFSQALNNLYSMEKHSWNMC